jgi:drug/metabolite transporter (DMT)-like permease
MVRFDVEIGSSEPMLTQVSSCFGIMDIFAKLLVDVHGIPTASCLLPRVANWTVSLCRLQAPVIFLRMLVTAVLASSYLKFQGVPDPIRGPKEARGWLVARGAVGIVNVFLFYNSLRFLPVGDALSIWFTAPIITSVLAALLLKEPYTLVEASCGLVSLVGVVCVVHPPTIFGSAAARPADQAIGFVFVTGGTVAGAVVFVIIRHIGKRADALFSVSYFGYMAALAMGFLMLVEPSQRVDLDQLSLSALFYLVGVRISMNPRTDRLN